MYRSSPLRSTWNTRYVTGLDMCKVCLKQSIAQRFETCVQVQKNVIIPTPPHPTPPYPMWCVRGWLWVEKMMQNCACVYLWLQSVCAGDSGKWLCAHVTPVCVRGWLWVEKMMQDCACVYLWLQSVCAGDPLPDRYFESWILILDPSVLSPEMPVAGQPVVFGLSGNPAPPKVINLGSSSKLSSVPWSTRWVMYQGFAAELHWSYLFLVNLAPLFHFGPLCGHKELCNAMMLDAINSDQAEKVMVVQPPHSTCRCSVEEEPQNVGYFGCETHCWTCASTQKEWLAYGKPLTCAMPWGWMLLIRAGRRSPCNASASFRMSLLCEICPNIVGWADAGCFSCNCNWLIPQCPFFFRTS